eukprot:403355925
MTFQIDLLNKDQQRNYYTVLSNYFMKKASYVNELAFQNITLLNKFMTRKFMQPLVDDKLYSIEKITFNQVKSENIFTVESLIQSIEKFPMITELEFNECCQSFCDKFFAHFASNSKNIKFVNNVRRIKLKKVIINQINMAAEVFFDKFTQLNSLHLDGCFRTKITKLPMEELPNLQGNQSQNRRNPPRQITNWQSVYQVYMHNAQFNLFNDSENILESIIVKNKQLKELTMRNCCLQTGFFSERFPKIMKAQEREKLYYLDMSHNFLDLDAVNTIGKFFISFNFSNLTVLKLAKVSEFTYQNTKFANLLVEILKKLNLKSNALNDKFIETSLPKYFSLGSGKFEAIEQLNLNGNGFVQRDLLRDFCFNNSLETLKIQRCYLDNYGYQSRYLPKEIDEEIEKNRTDKLYVSLKRDLKNTARKRNMNIQSILNTVEESLSVQSSLTQLPALKSTQKNSQIQTQKFQGYAQQPSPQRSSENVQKQVTLDQIKDLKQQKFMIQEKLIEQIQGMKIEYDDRAKFGQKQTNPKYYDFRIKSSLDSNFMKGQNNLQVKHHGQLRETSELDLRSDLEYQQSIAPTYISNTLIQNNNSTAKLSPKNLEDMQTLRYKDQEILTSSDDEYDQTRKSEMQKNPFRNNRTQKSQSPIRSVGNLK